MAELVYSLCAIISLMCALMLFRSYFKTNVRLLLWSGIAFIGLVFNNGLLFLDLIIYPESDLALFRIVPTFIGFLILVFGLLWDLVK